MDTARRSLRKMLLLAACLASALAGSAIVWVFAPSGFFALATKDLVAVAALIALPLLTAVVVRRDRAAQAAAAAQDAVATADQPIEPSPQRAPRRSVIHEPAFLAHEPLRERV